MTSAQSPRAVNPLTNTLVSRKTFTTPFENVFIRQEAPRFSERHGLVSELLEHHQGELSTQGVSDYITPLSL